MGTEPPTTRPESEFERVPTGVRSSTPATQEAWLERYRRVRRATEALAAPLSAEDQILQSMPDASPTKWHVAHTTWFFETFVLRDHASGYEPFHPEFAYLYNSYYEAEGQRHPRPQRGMITRPTLAEVTAYRRHVDAAVGALISGASTETLSRIAPILEIGLQHEQQHQELILTDIKHGLAQNPLRPAYRDDLAPSAQRGELRELEWVGFEGGLVELGHDGDGFAFDNEAPRHRVFIEPFQLASRPVTNGEFLRFIEDGGYEKATLWLSSGWDAVRSHGWTAPLYWEQRDGAWWQFTLGGLRRLHLDAPVCHVSYFEADAYATWAAARLPTEQEWELSATVAAIDGTFADDEVMQPRPTFAGAPVSGLMGDVWEWTSSAYAAYPGFRPLDGALGEYNGKFMCGQFVLRGGSCATPRSHIRSTYRNFFPPDARWQFSGFRLARSGG